MDMFIKQENEDGGGGRQGGMRCILYYRAFCSVLTYIVAHTLTQTHTQAHTHTL